MRSRLSTTLVAVAWVAVGGASLWSVNALADGLNGRRAAQAPPTSPVTEATPQFGQLLGGPQAEAPASPTPATPAAEQQASAECLTFEDVLASLDSAPVAEDRETAIQTVEAANPDIIWCEGVREGFMLALAASAPPRRPEAPRGFQRLVGHLPGDGGSGPPPGDGGSGPPPGDGGSGPPPGDGSGPPPGDGGSGPPPGDGGSGPPPGDGGSGPPPGDVGTGEPPGDSGGPGYQG